jgi:hypothetical protein
MTWQGPDTYAVPPLTNLLASNICFATFRLFLPFWFTFLNFDSCGISNRVPIRDYPLCAEGEFCEHV